MLAARWYGPRDVRLEDLADPQPRRDEVVVAVEWCGLCGTDLEEYLEGPVNIRESLRPVVLGHEIVGRVVEAAADGSGPGVGTKVVPDVVRGCGHCYWCARHEEGQCPLLLVAGLQLDGGLAEYFCAPAGRCVVVPDRLATPEAVLAEPMSVAVRALRKAGGLLGGSVVVIGCGTIGLLVTAAARAAGASSVIAVDPLGPRRAVAASFGGHPVAPNDAREATLDLTGGRGADVVVECSGSKGATARALALLRNGGLCVLVGFHGGSEEFTLLDVILPEKTLVGSAAHMWDDDVAPAVDLLAEGKGSFERIVTHRVPLADVVRGFELLASRDTAALKVAIEVAPGPSTSRR